MKIQWLGRDKNVTLKAKYLSKSYTAKDGIFEDMLEKDFKACLKSGGNTKCFKVLGMSDKDKAALLKLAEKEKAEALEVKTEKINAAQEVLKAAVEEYKNAKINVTNAKNADAAAKLQDVADLAKEAIEVARKAVEEAKK